MDRDWLTLGLGNEVGKDSWDYASVAGKENTEESGFLRGKKKGKDIADWTERRPGHRGA